jgi:hypothetical protein
MLLLAVDANFRLKNRMRKNEIDDPSLGPGWGYWVEPRKYGRHLRKYVNEKDVSKSVCACYFQADCQIGQHMYSIRCFASEGYPSNYWPARFGSGGCGLCTA